MVNDEILQYAIKRIHFKARQILGKYGFTENDFCDLRQELLLHVLKQLSKFDHDRADIRVFITALVDRRIANLIRDQKADCRDYRRVERSLDDWVPDEGDASEGTTWAMFGGTIPEDKAQPHLGYVKRSCQEQTELALDTSMVLEQLPDHDRDLCLRLQVHTVMEISRETGLSRVHIYQRIRAIRGKFLEAGMPHYF